MEWIITKVSSLQLHYIYKHDYSAKNKISVYSISHLIIDHKYKLFQRID